MTIDPIEETGGTSRTVLCARYILSRNVGICGCHECTHSISPVARS